MNQDARELKFDVKINANEVDKFDSIVISELDVKLLYFIIN